MKDSALDALLALPDSARPAPLRFALYYTPPRSSAWWTVGCDWLARDPETGETRTAPPIDGLDATSLADLTSAPRRYGWHATLYPPFVRAPQVTAHDVLTTTRQWAARHKPFTLSVQVATLGRFVAVQAAGPDAAASVVELAANALHALHPLRAAPLAAELAQRRAAGLTPRQDALLAQWGYPYVLDEYRFHMTLSNSIAAAHAEALVAWWRPRLPALGPLPIDGAALFVQPAPDTPFVLWRRVPFGLTA